jgi:hypothetical protein
MADEQDGQGPRQGAAKAVLITSTSQLAGRRFEPTAEKSLDPALSLAASTLQVARNRATLVLTECALPFGVPDALVLAIDDDAFQARLDSGIPAATTAAEISMICAARSRPRSGDDLIAASGLSYPVARRYLQRLESTGALHLSSGRFRASPSMRSVGRIFALEAKVTDWRAGHDQCLRYGSFADGTALVLPRVTERIRQPLLAAVEPHGIGVFADGRWVRRPRMSRLTVERRLQASESVVAGLGLAEAQSP